MAKLSLQVKLLPILKDNYVFVIFDLDRKEACVVDPGTFNEVIEFLIDNQLSLVSILITHQHHDHIGGVNELIQHFPNAVVYLSQHNHSISSSHQKIVSLSHEINLSFINFLVLDLPGHTLDHIAFYNYKMGWLFSGDVIFGLGCGRVFEGTLEQAYLSLQKIKKLPLNTLIFCTHEYTLVNSQFCQKYFMSQQLQVYIEDIQEDRRNNRPTVPLELKKEMALNPFLLAQDLTEFIYARELRNIW